MTEDALAVGNRAAYLWYSTGILDSKIFRAFARQAGASVTARNRATVHKLRAAPIGGDAGRRLPTASSIATPTLRL